MLGCFIPSLCPHCHPSILLAFPRFASLVPPPTHTHTHIHRLPPKGCDPDNDTNKDMSLKDVDIGEAAPGTPLYTRLQGIKAAAKLHRDSQAALVTAQTDSVSLIRAMGNAEENMKKKEAAANKKVGLTANAMVHATHTHTSVHVERRRESPLDSAPCRRRCYPLLATSGAVQCNVAHRLLPSLPHHTFSSTSSPRVHASTPHVPSPLTRLTHPSSLASSHPPLPPLLPSTPPSTPLSLSLSIPLPPCPGARDPKEARRNTQSRRGED